MVKSKVKVPVQIPPYRYNGGVGRRYRQYGFDGTVDLSSSCVTGGRLRGSILASSKLWNGWDWGELFWWMGGLYPAVRYHNSLYYSSTGIVMGKLRVGQVSLVVEHGCCDNRCVDGMGRCGNASAGRKKRRKK